ERDLADLPATVYVGLGHAERFPDYWELFSPKQGPDGSVNAFRGVKPEKTTQIDFGAQYKTETLDAWLSGYAGYVDDFILFDYAKSRMGGMGGMHGGHGGHGSSTQAANIDARIAGG
ncbi:TonB-dependent receptor, partial [Yersinia pestis]